MISTAIDVIRKLIAEQFAIDIANVKGDSILSDFDGDSLDDVEIVIFIEDEFEIHVPDEDAMNCKTVQDLADLVDKINMGATK